MTRNKKLIPLIYIQFIVCFVLLLTIAHAKSSAETTLSSNSINKITQINGKAEKGNADEAVKKSHDNNFVEIMSTKNGCTASCCANNQMNEKASNPDKIDKKKNKRKRSGLFSWFK